MAKGVSGRVVIEIDPALKRSLYSALATESQTLKDWFIVAASAYLRGKSQQPQPRVKQGHQSSVPRKKT